MRILVLSKRQYMGKDLIDDKYGRFYHLPEHLAGLGHQVTGVCLSYRTRNQGHLLGPELEGSRVNWHSVNIGKVVVPGMLKYFKKLDQICITFQPEVIIAFSDAIHVSVGAKLAIRHKITYVADLYDNFESFGLTRIPGLFSSFKKAVASADVVTCVSDLLTEHVKENYEPKGEVKTLTNGVPSGHFKPMDKYDCRSRLGLPAEATLIGTAGALAANRGIDLLFKSVIELINVDPRIHLVLAGPISGSIKLPEGERIHYLGHLDYEIIPTLFNSLDVGVICNRDSSFGRFCFPQKAYEMWACRLPVVAADVGVMGEMMRVNPKCLYVPNEHDSIIHAITYQLRNKIVPKDPIPTWENLAKELEHHLLSLLRDK